jgi:hypothetical protein
LTVASLSRVIAFHSLGVTFASLQKC